MVGWEGIWGVLLSCMILSFTFCYPGFIKKNILSNFQTFYILDAIVGCSDNFLNASFQMLNNPKIFLSVFIGAFVIGPFNYFGSGLTKISTAAHRSTVDSLRMFTVWVICVMTGYEEFRPSQIFGYFLMILGSMIYNKVKILMLLISNFFR